MEHGALDDGLEGETWFEGTGVELGGSSFTAVQERTDHRLFARRPCVATIKGADPCPDKKKMRKAVAISRRAVRAMGCGVAYQHL